MEIFDIEINRIGLIADTHVPDRRPALHPGVLPAFADLKVDLILHAGDICSMAVVNQLSMIAPVRSVRGNRDLFGLNDYQSAYSMKIRDLTIGLTHGHGNFFKYLLDKVKYMIKGPQVFGIARRRALEMFNPFPDILVYGHNHHPEITELESTLVINPGSPCCPIPRSLPPTIGLIEFSNGKAVPKIISLESGKLK